MISDYSEVTATIHKKLQSLDVALADRKWNAAAAILRDLNNNVEKLIEYVTTKYGEKHE